MLPPLLCATTLFPPGCHSTSHHSTLPLSATLTARKPGTRRDLCAGAPIADALSLRLPLRASKRPQLFGAARHFDSSNPLSCNDSSVCLAATRAIYSALAVPINIPTFAELLRGFFGTAAHPAAAKHDANHVVRLSRVRRRRLARSSGTASAIEFQRCRRQGLRGQQ